MITGFIVGPLLAGLTGLTGYFLQLPWWASIPVGLALGASCMLASLRLRLP